MYGHKNTEIKDEVRPLKVYRKKINKRMTSIHYAKSYLGGSGPWGLGVRENSRGTLIGKGS